MSENKTNIPNVCGYWEYQSPIDLDLGWVKEDIGSLPIRTFTLY